MGREGRDGAVERPHKRFRAFRRGLVRSTMRRMDARRSRPDERLSRIQSASADAGRPAPFPATDDWPTHSMTAICRFTLCRMAG